MNKRYFVYTLRPDNTALWLPNDLCMAMGLKRGDKLTPAQYNSARIQDLLEKRRRAKLEDELG